MYTKNEASLIKQEFWTGFGRYLSLSPSAGGEKINWINYKTGIKNIRFKMDAFKDSAIITIELSHREIEKRHACYEVFTTLKPQLEKELNEKWIWEKDVTIDNKQVSRIYHELKQVSIFNRSDWPVIISYLKPRIMALDRFWTAHKEILEMSV